MESQGDKPDGSSIKPVSSLRSHFEQMTTSSSLKPSATPPRPISPKPKSHMYSMNSSTNSSTEAISSGSMRTGGTNGIAATAIPPSSYPRQKPLSAASPASFPAVTIDPPSSPPKGDTPNHAMSKTINLLAAEHSPSSSPSATAPSSPRHFRMPSRPQTPIIEIRKSPSVAVTQPPEPPPPRRSGELRRDTSVKPSMGPPPPVNRADKPRLGSRQPSRSPSLSARVPMSHVADHISPFNSPPTSSESSPSPEREDLPPPITRPRPVTMDNQTRAYAIELNFEPPPVHHSIASKRRDHEATSTPRTPLANQTKEDAPELRPILPVRHTTTMPPPARTSIENHRQNVATSAADPPKPTRNHISQVRPADSGTNFATPPKRIFSTPTSQAATPPRHGRSMTVDHTSNRAPAELRTPIKTNIQATNHKDISTSPQRTTKVVESEHVASSVTEYPEPIFSNRRPPRHKDGPSEISYRYDARVFDVCGDHICVAGVLTRVWSLRDGEQIFSAAHGEGIKIMSVAFKPAANVEDEGSRIWLGNNFGELVEIDIISHSMIGSKTNAHARHEILKIYRHQHEMWTLDDVGTLHVWAPDSRGSPNLDTVPTSFRVPKGHSFSMIVGDELWYAIGKDIRIFAPTSDGTSQFQVLQRPITQASAGDVTSGAVLTGQPDKVYIGHSDGKVSIYSTASYSCLGIINVNMYKINTLAGVGDYLWAGYNTGMIYVYDTTQSPWAIKKDWRAHDNPVVTLVRDRASFWKMDRSQIVSLGADNVVRIWDGMLQDDWLETKMQSSDTSFCKFEKLKAVVMTWNAGASTPHSLRYNPQDADFMQELLQSSESPDIIVFGFQELIDLEDKKTTAKSFFKSKKKDPSAQEHMSHQYRDWKDYLQRSLDEHLPHEEMYHLLHSASLVGLFTCIFVKSRLRERIRGVCGVQVKRGMGGLHGNKGALIIRFMLADTSICFVNCHLAAGQTQTKDRNFDVAEILESTTLPIERDPIIRMDSYAGGGDGSMILDHEICIFNGDLNYRIDTMSRDAVVNAVKQGNRNKLLERDQLLASKRKNPAFRLRAFNELPIDFDPTYKYDVGTDRYDTSEKKRAPAWCDRILSRSRNPARLKQLDYRRHEVRVSDHRPVSALFYMTIKTISQKNRDVVWNECRQKLEDAKRDWAAQSNFEFLSSNCGYDPEESKMIVRDQAARKSL